MFVSKFRFPVTLALVTQTTIKCINQFSGNWLPTAIWRGKWNLPALFQVILKNIYIYPFAFNLNFCQFSLGHCMPDRHLDPIMQPFCIVIIKCFCEECIFIRADPHSPPPSQHTSVGGNVLNQSNQGGMEIHNDNLHYLSLLGFFLFKEHHNLKRKIFYYKKIIMRKIREEYVTTEVFVEGTFRKHINNNGSFGD